MKRLLMVLVLLAGLASNNPATSAQAALDEEIRIFRSVETELCLDSNWDDSEWEGSVYTLSCNGGRYQNWYVIYVNDYVALRHQASGLCLKSYSYGPSYGRVYTAHCNYMPHEYWYVYTEADGTVFLQNKASFQCLDSNEYREVYTIICNRSDYQRWAEH